MSMKHYLAARKEGLKQQHAAQARGQDPYLPVLSELVPTLNKLPQVPLGLVQIALAQIEMCIRDSRSCICPSRISVSGIPS